MLQEVELSEVGELYEKYPHQLSGGMRQRVMIAAALVTEPKLLIADEPTTALDVTVQTQILKLLGKINAKHRTGILFISHDLSVVRRLCHRVIVMNQGKIEEMGAVEEIFKNPQKEYTKKLLEAVPTRGKSLRRRRRWRTVKNVLEVKQVCVSYKEGKHQKEVLKDISFEVRENEILGLVGERSSESPHSPKPFWDL